MTIGIVTTYTSKNPAGLERATLDLLKAVLGEDRQNQYLIYTKKGSELGKLLSGHNNAKVVEVGLGRLWKDLGLFFAPRSDVYVFNGPQAPLFFKPKNYAVIIYDFAYKIINQKGGLLNWLNKLALVRAKIVFAISQATKDDAVRLFNVNPDKIKVLHLGFTDMSKQIEEKVSNLPDKFFISVGTIKERKNTFNIVKAFDQYQKSDHGVSLVIAGKYNSADQYARGILDYIRDQNLSGKVILLNHVSDSELAYLYKRALALVYPTLLEGFGLPILEAFSVGLPMITSRTSSLPEIAGEAALLVDPDNAQDILSVMSKLANNPDLSQSLKQKGLERASQFSWSKTAQNFIKIINTNF